jgi:hypothetical protein
MIARSLGLLWLSAAAAVMSAADLSGVWTGQLPGRNNTFTDIAFKFVQQPGSGAITGKLYGDYASNAIVDGKIEGDKIEFVVVTREQRGNEINDTRFKFTGTFKDGEMELTRERQAVTKVASGEPVTVRNDTKPVIKLKRLT